MLDVILFQEERRIVYIGKISDSMTKDDVWKRFRSFGPIEKVSVHIREKGYVRHRVQNLEWMAREFLALGIFVWEVVHYMQSNLINCVQVADISFTTIKIGIWRHSNIIIACIA